MHVHQKARTFGSISHTRQKGWEMAKENGSTLYDDSVVIDALNYFPDFTGDYLQTMLDAGVTAINATLPNQSPFSADLRSGRRETRQYGADHQEEQ